MGSSPVLTFDIGWSQIDFEFFSYVSLLSVDFCPRRFSHKRHFALGNAFRS